MNRKFKCEVCRRRVYQLEKLMHGIMSDMVCADCWNTFEAKVTEWFAERRKHEARDVEEVGA